MNLPEKFCIAPFKNLVVDTSGHLMPCCEYLSNGDTKVEHVIEWWNNGLTKVRDDMINGIPNKNCDHCLAKESNEEYYSHRKYLNSTFKNEITKIVTDYKNGIISSVGSAELRSSNYCNLKCIMCGDYASSSIRDEYQKNTIKYNSVNVFMGNVKTVKWWDDASIIDDLTKLFNNVNTMRLAGGEPLLVSKLFEIVKEIQTNNSCTISFNTSLYTKNYKLLQMVSNLKNLTVLVSVEGIGPHNDYIRNGSEWDIIQKNLQLFKNFKFSHVLQHTSVFALPKLFEYCQINNIDINISEVYYGSYPSDGVLTINSAHPTDVNKFKDWLLTYTGRHKKMLDIWVDNYKYEPELNIKFHEYMSVLDDIRGTNFNETFNPTL